jgi:hypothetical protein
VAKAKELKPNEGNVRKVKHVQFEYYEEVENPQDPKNPRLAARYARQGEIVDIPRDADVERGERFGAFFTDAELKNADAPTGSVAVAEKTDQQLIDWITEDRPNVNQTIEAAGGDPSLAQRILDAESAATGGDPRQGVVDGLATVIDRGNA